MWSRRPVAVAGRAVVAGWPGAAPAPREDPHLCRQTIPRSGRWTSPRPSRRLRPSHHADGSSAPHWAAATSSRHVRRNFLRRPRAEYTKGIGIGPRFHERGYERVERMRQSQPRIGIIRFPQSAFAGKANAVASGVGRRASGVAPRAHFLRHGDPMPEDRGSVPRLRQPVVADASLDCDPSFTCSAGRLLPASAARRRAPWDDPLHRVSAARLRASSAGRLHRAGALHLLRRDAFPPPSSPVLP